MNLTKTLPPRPSLVLERERLLSKLRSWEDKKLVIIHAQAGQGKSTLASDYALSLPNSPIWYNIDQQDDDPSVFLSLLGQAAHLGYPGIPNLPPPPLERYGLLGLRQGIGRWTGQIFGSLPPPSLVVFDDFANLSSPSALQIMKALIFTTPPHVRFLLVSRTMPELEIARLRAMGAVGVITGDDLKFNGREVHSLFTSVFGLQLTPEEADCINGIAEGWPAGLVLMHEYFSTAPAAEKRALLSGQKPAGFQAFVFDYLAQEVFSHLPRELQDFLLRTSIADYLPLELISELTGLPVSAESHKPSIEGIVRELRKKNLFLTASGDSVHLIRYHTLFREFLRKSLYARLKPAEIVKLATTAARYFTRLGDPVRAVNLYLSSGQTDKAADELQDYGQQLITRGQIRSLLLLSESLPMEYQKRPWLIFNQAVAYRFMDPRRALALFERAFDGFRSSRHLSNSLLGQMLSACGIIEACFYSGGDFKRMERAAATARSVLARNRRETGAHKVRLLHALGMAYFFIGRLNPGIESLRKAVDEFARSGDSFSQIHSAIYLVPCCIYKGDFRQARAVIRRGFEALKSIPEDAGSEAALNMAQAMTALFEGNFEEARQCIKRCRNLAQEHDFEAINFLSLDIGGWLMIATAQYPKAEALLTECKRRAEEVQNEFFNASAAHLLSVSYLHQGKLEKAREECEYALSIRKQAGSTLFFAVSLSASGAINLKLRNFARAGRELAEALRIFRRINALQQEANVLLLLSLLAFKTKKARPAEEYLAEGLRLGRDQGFTYYYLLNSADMVQLADRALKQDIAPDFCRVLIKNYSTITAGPQVNIYCLGRFRVCRDESIIPESGWKGKQSKRLLKLLAAHEGQKLQRDVIIEMLWPDAKSGDDSRQRFNSLLYRLRKILDPDAATGIQACILYDENLLALNKDRVWTDTGQLLSHLEAAARFKAGNNAKKAVQEYESALSLYQGDFLCEDMYEDWAAPVRDRFRNLYHEALEDAAALCESLEERNKTAEFYEKLFLSDQCNETACRWLMQWHISCGNRDEAVKTYDRCRLELMKELDAEPEALTKKLYRGIIGG